jgi:hypothetical protein
MCNYVIIPPLTSRFAKHPPRQAHTVGNPGAFAAAGLNQVDQAIDRLSYPMQQEEIGHHSVVMAPWFIPGLKNSVSKRAAIEAAGLSTEETAKLAKPELIEKLAAGGVEWTEKEYRKVLRAQSAVARCCF